MSNSPPQELLTTLELIRRAFNGAPSSAELPGLTRVLYDHLSDRQLASVLAHLTDQPEEIAMNRVYDASSLSMTSAEVESAMEKLLEAGFQEWCDED